MICLENFHLASEGEIFCEDNKVVSVSDEVLREATEFDRILTENFGSQALHKIFGLQEGHGDARIYMSFTGFSMASRMKTFSFVIIHRDFQYFKISIKVVEGRMSIYLNKIIKSKDSRERGLFRKVVGRMLSFVFSKDLFQSVDLIAARKGNKYSGYFYWPEIGFEATEAIEADGLPCRFQDFSPEDFRKWREVGVTTHMTCDRELWRRYTASKFRMPKLA